MANTFDLIVIGTGSAAAGVASRCRRAGWRVAIIDSLPYGGTCALRGCDPKKLLVGATEAIDWVRRMKGKGITADGVGVNWSELIPESREKRLAAAGIERFHGRARFTGPTTVEVGGDVLQSKYIHIATGAKPADLKIPGQEHMITSTQFLELDVLPSRVAFIGGGYISFEFAHIAARAGAQVTLLHRGARPLKGFDPDLVGLLVERTKKLGFPLSNPPAMDKGCRCPRRRGSGPSKLTWSCTAPGAFPISTTSDSRTRTSSMTRAAG